jgi:hypothetical protein
MGLGQLRALDGTTQLSAMSPSDCKPVIRVQTTPPSINILTIFFTRQHTSNNNYCKFAEMKKK